ncbi:hypothetical protein GCM10022221_04480 [Actinocorallia aurea]
MDGKAEGPSQPAGKRAARTEWRPSPRTRDSGLIAVFGGVLYLVSYVLQDSYGLDAANVSFIVPGFVALLAAAGLLVAERTRVAGAGLVIAYAVLDAGWLTYDYTESDHYPATFAVGAARLLMYVGALGTAARLFASRPRPFRPTVGSLFFLITTAVQPIAHLGIVHAEGAPLVIDATLISVAIAGTLVIGGATWSVERSPALSLGLLGGWASLLASLVLYSATGSGVVNSPWLEIMISMYLVALGVHFGINAEKRPRA